MKFTKMLGICVIAALATMAMVGAGTASATTLCKVAEDPCGAANRYPSGTEVLMGLKSSTQITISTSTFSEKCSSSSILGKSTAISGSPLPLSGVGPTLFSCGGPCTEFTITNPNITLEGTGGGSGKLAMNVDIAMRGCAFGIKCRFFSESIGASATGNPLEVAFEKVPVSVEGPALLCGKEATLNATYVVGTPSALHVSKEP